MSLRSWFSNDLGIDLGTCHTRVYMRGRGIVFSEPSIVALDKEHHVLGLGDEVHEIQSEDAELVTVVRPLKDGAIANLDLAAELVKYCMQKVRRRRLWTRVVIGVHNSTTPVERNALDACARTAGASEVFLIEGAAAAALGADLEIDKPFGTMVVNIGGGTTDVNVMSMGSPVFSYSSKVAGQELDNAILNYVRMKYDMSIGPRMAEEVKFVIGSALHSEVDTSISVQARDLRNGELKMLQLSRGEIVEVLREGLSEIVRSINYALARTPPELAGDLTELGIVLTGGGANLIDLDAFLAAETGLPVEVAEDPLNAVVLGLGMTLSNFELLERIKEADLYLR